MKDHNFITDTLLVAGLTLLGYLTAFSYEYGYLTYFNVPPDLIEIDITRILISMVIVFGSVWILFSLLELFSLFGLLKMDTAANRSRGFSLILIAYGLLMILIYRDSHYAILWGIMILLMVSTEFLFPFLHKDKHTWEEKVAAQEEIERKHRSAMLTSKIIEKMGRATFQFLYFSIIFVFTAFNLGNAAALNQTSFTVLGQGSNEAVIRIYSGFLVVVGFDRENKKLTNQFFLINKNSVDANIPLVKEKIGPSNNPDLALRFGPF